jgi:hypothetical protein
MAETIDALMDSGSSILVLVPFTWRVHAYPDDYWRMTPSALDVLFPLVEWEARCFVLEDGMCEVIPRMNHNGKWLMRSEIAAFGRKC